MLVSPPRWRGADDGDERFPLGRDADATSEAAYDRPVQTAHRHHHPQRAPCRHPHVHRLSATTPQRLTKVGVWINKSMKREEMEGGGYQGTDESFEGWISQRDG